MYLKLKKPVRARGLKVALIGEQKTTQHGGLTTVSTGGGYCSSTQTRRVYNFEIPLNGEKEYTGGGIHVSDKNPGKFTPTHAPLGWRGQCITNGYWDNPKNKLVCESVFGYPDGG